MKKLLFYILFILLISKIAFFSVGCAVMSPPSGGFKDTLPPLLVMASPHDSSNNFKEKRITLTFDEFVQIDNAPANVIVSPLSEREPEVSSKLRTVTVRFRDTLQPNTTYAIDFGKAIKDVNEGNIAKNFTYIFSTGAVFDSLTISGKVLLAETGKVDSTLIVMLHKNGDDSAVVNEKPQYIARLDSLGNFTFRNLPADTFYLYALQDQGGSHKYLSEKSLFAFADSAFITQNNNAPVTLYAYSINESTTPAANKSLPQISKRQRPGANTEKRLKMVTNLSSNQLDLLDSLVITFELPVRNLDTTLIHFSSDTTFTPITNYHIVEDTTQKKLTFEYNWKENTVYNIIFEKDFAEDTLGNKLLKTDTLTFKTKKLSDYGSLVIHFKNLDLSQNPVLQFVQNNSVVKSDPLTSTELHESIFRPGDYELRILYDRNNNGKWDAGDFFKNHLQPEIVIPVKSRPKISVKPNWSNEFDIAL
jgi:hypothetical protein